VGDPPLPGIRFVRGIEHIGGEEFGFRSKDRHGKAPRINSIIVTTCPKMGFMNPVGKQFIAKRFADESCAVWEADAIVADRTPRPFRFIHFSMTDEFAKRYPGSREFREKFLGTGQFQRMGGCGGPAQGQRWYNSSENNRVNFRASA